jgi:isoleucyl-tRNA synthetase
VESCGATGEDAASLAEARSWLLLYPQLAAFCRRVQRRTSLSMTEIAVLFALHDAGTVGMRELRRSVAADAGHLSRILAAFERDGMVALVASASDGRMRQAMLTALGTQRCLAVSAAAAEIAREMPATQPKAGALSSLKRMFQPACSVGHKGGGGVMFEAVDQHPDLPAMEEKILARWKDRGVLRQALHQNSDGPLFRFYDGPPTANGRPGAHHVEARVFKDVFPRYRAMKGYRVPRRAGWDCHGIPVELEVERDLGFTSKNDIERYGVAAFNERCRESVTRYVAEFDNLTRRVGYWVDTEDAYWTMSAEYVDSVWWSLKMLHDRGLMYEDFRVTPYCPRCGTALSDHEVSQGYREVEDLSVFVRLPLLTGPLARGEQNDSGASLLVWTTMPWTFMATTAAVVGGGISYVLARGGRAGTSPVVLAADCLEAALGPDAEVIRDVSLDEIIGARYQGPFNYAGPGSASDPGGDPASWRVVVVGDFVTTGQGSGIVSTGAAFGEDDLRVARANGLPVVNPVLPDGRFDVRCGPYAGMDVRAADASIVEDLRRRGLLVHSHGYRHSYPFCWRCETPLLYYAKPSWYIQTTKLADRMIAHNDRVDWRPEHIKQGRYGEWLRGNVDWALSRERYWGTPLPIWRCRDCRETTAVGSRAELSRLAGHDLSGLDPHRPYVDSVTLRCGSCDGTMHRVPEVVDAWYDSGSMPFAQVGYPYCPGSPEAFAALFPADYICEGIDQTRGWFYALQAVSTALFGESSYQRALCLGHIVDAEGRKMSKSAGNVADPWHIIGVHGADALRWLLLAEGSPWQSRRVTGEALREVTRKVLLTVWNTYYFFVTYARLGGWAPERTTSPDGQAGRPVMDRYILAELADTVETVDRTLEGFDATGAGRRIAGFVEDLSNWYVRRCRERFWGTGRAGCDSAAFTTLYECLTTLALLLAPFTPFLADELHENLVRKVDPSAPASVHLARFPSAVPEPGGASLRQAMADARRLVALGRDGRRSAGIPVRQPLARALVAIPPDRQHQISQVQDVIADELNVASVELADAVGEQVVSYTLKPDFRALGKAFGPRTQQVAAAIRAADPTVVIATLRRDGNVTLPAEGSPVTLDASVMSVISEPVTGWQLSSDGGYSIALDLAVTDDLRRSGLARELVRHLNDLRKRNGFARSDRIAVRMRIDEDPDGMLRSAIEQHRDAIARDVLAVELTFTGHHGAETETLAAAHPGVAAKTGQQTQSREPGPAAVPLQAGAARVLVSVAPARI